MTAGATSAARHLQRAGSQHLGRCGKARGSGWATVAKSTANCAAGRRIRGVGRKSQCVRHPCSQMGRPNRKGGNNMAQYKYQQYLNHSNHSAYDALHSPGSNCPDSGIYRCEGCGHEIASNKNNPLPPQNHHQHSPAQGTIRWRLIVFAQG